MGTHDQAKASASQVAQAGPEVGGTGELTVPRGCIEEDPGLLRPAELRQVVFPVGQPSPQQGIQRRKSHFPHRTEHRAAGEQSLAMPAAGDEHQVRQVVHAGQVVPPIAYSLADQAHGQPHQQSAAVEGALCSGGCEGDVGAVALGILHPANTK